MSLSKLTVLLAIELVGAATQRPQEIEVTVRGVVPVRQPFPCLPSPAQQAFGGLQIVQGPCQQPRECPRVASGGSREQRHALAFAVRDATVAVVDDPPTRLYVRRSEALPHGARRALFGVGRHRPSARPFSCSCQHRAENYRSSGQRHLNFGMSVE